MKNRSLACLAFLLLAPTLAAQEGQEVPVTIKELDLKQSIREFQQFRNQLEQYRQEVTKGQSAAVEIGQILEDLQKTATPENGHNEGKILKAIEGYVDTVIVKQVQLVDFLESQRYRITYYANKMAASVRPEDVAVLFGTEEENQQAIEQGVRSVDAAQGEIADFIDSLPEDQFDKRTFRSLSGITPENQARLNQLQYRYQSLQSTLKTAKSRLALVRQAQRTARQGTGSADLNVDLLLGQMFGALDRIRLQMSGDLLNLETFLGRFAHTAQTQEVFEAFQQLVSAQGGLQGPSPGLANVLDWLQDSSNRHMNLSLRTLDNAGPGLNLSRSSDLLREAYSGARNKQ